MTKLLLPPTAISSRDGEHSDQNARRLAELLSEYDRDLSLEYVPEADKLHASVHEILHPYRIVKTTAMLGREVVKYITGEQMKKPNEILYWIWEGDFRKHNPHAIIDRIEKQESIARMFELKKEQEAAQERQDVLAWGASGGVDGKHFLRYNKRVKLSR